MRIGGWVSVSCLLIGSACGTAAVDDAGIDVGVDANNDANRPHDAGVDGGYDAGDAEYVDAASPLALEVRTLGVQGFVLSYAGESVLTAPLFTRQRAFDVGVGAPITFDAAAIDEGLAEIDTAAIRAIVSGHAHYDHLLDVVHVMTSLTTTAPLYANLTAQHIFAAVAPDRDASCTTPAPAETIDRARVIAMDDPLMSHVDYTNCPDQLPPGAPMEGSWVRAPGSHVRLYAVCTTHPDQIGSAHFAPGNIDTDQCDLPVAARDWLEGHTISFVIDFLDDADAVMFRIYYQDAPATRPIGYVPTAILAEHAVDLALLNVGSNQAVENQPTDIIGHLTPRFVVSGHWEDFFSPLDEPPQPIALLDVNLYVDRAEAALTAPPDAPLVLDGVRLAGRHVLSYPGSRVIVPPAP